MKFFQGVWLVLRNPLLLISLFIFPGLPGLYLLEKLMTALNVVDRPQFATVGLLLIYAYFLVVLPVFGSFYYLASRFFEKNKTVAIREVLMVTSNMCFQAIVYVGGLILLDFLPGNSKIIYVGILLCLAGFYVFITYKKQQYRLIYWDIIMLMVEIIFVIYLVIVKK